MSGAAPRTRLWEDPTGCSSTVVQFRTDTDPAVYLHTNIGWVPIGNAPADLAEAEGFAAEMAAHYNLAEATEERARYMAGFDEDEED